MKSFETKSWNTHPISEDIHIRSFNALRLEHLSLKFDINNLNQLNVYEEVNKNNICLFILHIYSYHLFKNLLRICYLRRFGYLIASLSKSQNKNGGVEFFEYNAVKCLFKALDIKNDLHLAKEDSTENKEIIEKNEINSSTNENRKFQLMKNMAQLRLEVNFTEICLNQILIFLIFKAEISQLESNYKNDDLNWSPYIVADTAALCNNLKIMQELAKSTKFNSKLIIPLVVIDNLDSIKKDSKQAREAIRWLENQFKQGNRFVIIVSCVFQKFNFKLFKRFLRAQIQSEKIACNYDSNLKKKNLELWRFYQLIECCKYFQNTINQENLHNNEDKVTNMITILTHNDLQDAKNKHLINIADENGIIFNIHILLILILIYHKFFISKLNL